VQIAIPYSTIIDVDKSTALDFRETIEVKVVDGIEDLAVDSYFFTYFHDISAALEQIRDAIARTRPFVPEAQEFPGAEQLIDTTVSRSNSTSRTGTSEHNQTYPDAPPRSSSSFRLSALLRPFQEIPLGRVASSPGQQDEHEEFTHVEKRDNSSFVPIALPTSPSDTSTNQGNEFLQSHTTRKAHTIPSSHTYPPFTSGESLAQTTQEQSLATSWVSVPSWLRMSRRSLGGSSGASNQQSAEAKAVTEVYSSGTLASSQGAELGYSVLETPDSAIDPEMIEKFQTLFAFDDKEKLFGCSCSST
jgi:sterol 3beta-glucosyltransferase